jgi:hypothetical protein
MNKMKISTVVVLLFASVVTNAQTPVITNVSGSFDAGTVITITGNGFGEKVPAAPVLWDRVSNQLAYQRLGISNNQIVPVRADGCADCPWEAQTPPSLGNLMRYWTTDPRTAGGATYHSTVKGYFRGYDMGLDSPKVLYVNWWFRASSASIINTATKLIRVWTDGTGDYRSSWCATHMTYEQDFDHDGLRDEDEGIPAPADWGNWGGITGQWNNLEEIVDGRNNLSTGYGIIQTRTNHNLIHNLSNWGPHPYNYIDVFGLDPADASYTADVSFDFTDVYIDTSLARVLISNTPTLVGGTHAEIQIPTTWSNEVVQVTVNRGSFPAGSTLYAHVFSPAGVKSNFIMLSPGADLGPPGISGTPILRVPTVPVLPELFFLTGSAACSS